MKGKQPIITHLNKLLSCELSAINQYFLHARMFQNWGFQKLNDKLYKKSIQDMKHADKLIERILFLESPPNIKKLENISIGSEPIDILKNDLKELTHELSLLDLAIAEAEIEQDFVTRDLLCEFLADEQDHLDWIESQFELINMTSIENYLQSQI